MINDEPRRSEREVRRVAAHGRRTDDNSGATLLVIQDNDRRWTFHGLGAPGITLLERDAQRLCHDILGRRCDG